jgi:hypothetical protein
MLAAFAALTTLSALGYVDAVAPHVSGAITLTLLLLLVPFALGAAVGRGWIVLFMFLTVLATALLPDRTVVHASANAVSYTTYDTSLVPTLPFALVAATAAYAGVIARRPVGPALLARVGKLTDTAVGQTLLLITGGLLLGWPGVIAVGVALLLLAAARR